MAEAVGEAAETKTAYQVFYTVDGVDWKMAPGTFQGGQDAVKSDAAEQTGISGTYFAVPLTSFKPEAYVIPERPKPIKASKAE